MNLGYWDSKLKHCGVFAFSACRGPFYSLFYVSVACVVCVNCRQKRRHVVVGEGKGKITSVRGPQVGVRESEIWVIFQDFRRIESLNACIKY